MAKTSVALEITEESVRAVEMTTGRAPTLVAAGEVPLPREAAKDSEVLDPDAVAVALRQLWTSAGIKGRRVTVGVGSRRILVREYTTQAMKPELLRQALPFQVQDLLPVPVAQAVLDFYPLSQTGDMVSGLLVATVSETMEQIIATLAKAKLQAEAVDLVPFGLARVAKRVAEPGETVAMIHIGDHTSHVVAATDGIPHFVRIIPVDVATTAARREELATPTPELELEEMLESVPPRPSGAGTRAAMRTNGGANSPAVNDLVARLRSTIAFFAARPGAPQVTRVCMSGAGYLAPGVAETLIRAFDLPVVPVRLDQLINVGKHPLPDELAFNSVATAGVLFGEGTR